MKKIIIATLLLVTAFKGFTQDKPCLEVRGIAKLTRDVESYITDIVIAEDLSYEEKQPYETLRKAFFTKATAEGLAENRFKENKIGYASLQYSGDGNLYSFETKDTNDILKLQKVANIKYAASVIGRRVVYKPIQDEQKIIEEAYNDSKQKAAKIAQAMNKKLGSISCVIDGGMDVTDEDSYYYHSTPYNNYYYLTVKYTLE